MLLRLTLAVFLFYITVADALGSDRNHYLEAGVRTYLQCIERYSSFAPVISSDDFFKDFKYLTPITYFVEDCKYEFVKETIKASMRKKGFSDSCTPLTTKEDTRNRNFSPIYQRSYERLEINRTETEISSSKVVISGKVEASVTVKEKDIGGEVSAEKGIGEEETTVTDDVTIQTWKRTYQVPPLMRGITELSQCKRLMEDPKVTYMRISGCVRVSFPNDPKPLIADDIWLKCGASRPVGWELCSGDYMIRFENFPDEWKRHSKSGGLFKEYTNKKLYEIPFTKFERIARAITDEAANSSYCDALDPNTEVELVEQEATAEQIEITRVTKDKKDLGDFTWDFKPKFEDAEPKEDEEEDDDKKKEKEEKKEEDKTKKKRKPGRRSKKPKSG